MGVLLGAAAPTMEFSLRNRVGYQWAFAGFEIVTIAVLIVTLLLGKERKGRGFHRPATMPVP